MGKANEAARPAYRQALEAIGWYFDQQLYRGVFVAEVEDGYIGKARPAEEDAELRGEGFTFPRDDVAALIAAMPDDSTFVQNDSPLVPGGYHIFMRAVGEMCDRTGGAPRLDPGADQRLRPVLHHARQRRRGRRAPPSPARPLPGSRTY